jgi:predicted Zn finger-like uncharacterized protein
MNAAVQGVLFEISAPVPDGIEPGVILRVPAGADIARPGEAYRLTVTSAPVFSRTPSGAQIVSVRGDLRRPAGTRAARMSRWATLKAGAVEVIPAAPDAPEVSLPLPGGWLLVSNPCPACHTRYVVQARGQDGQGGEFRCNACQATGTAELVSSPAGRAGR